MKKIHTLRGFSFGAKTRSLLLQRSIRVNLPDFPVACARAKTTSLIRDIQDSFHYKFPIKFSTIPYLTSSVLGNSANNSLYSFDPNLQFHPMSAHWGRTQSKNPPHTIKTPNCSIISNPLPSYHMYQRHYRFKYFPSYVSATDR